MTVQHLSLGIQELLQKHMNGKRWMLGLVEEGEGILGLGGQSGWTLDIAKGAGLSGPLQGCCQPCRGEIVGAGDAHQTLPIPDTHHGGCALAGLQLLGLTTIHLNGGVMAAGDPQIPRCNAHAGGPLRHVLSQGGAIQSHRRW